MINSNCPFCGSKSLIKKGKRVNKFKQVQLLLCKECNKRFTDDKFKSKTHTIATTVKALSAYNSGQTIEETARKTKIARSTIANWIKEYKSFLYICKKIDCYAYDTIENKRESLRQISLVIR